MSLIQALWGFDINLLCSFLGELRNKGISNCHPSLCSWPSVTKPYPITWNKSSSLKCRVNIWQVLFKVIHWWGSVWKWMLYSWNVIFSWKIAILHKNTMRISSDSESRSIWSNSSNNLVAVGLLHKAHLILKHDMIDDFGWTLIMDDILFSGCIV